MNREHEHENGEGLPSPDELKPAAALAAGILHELDAMLLGRSELHRLLLAGLLARGHILLEGLPGLGKTALIQALGDILQLDFKRVQFTPDLMPGDILGSNILQPTADGGRDLVFHPGPVFCNLLLADEINRASPKTQSAMLETMQERRVTLLGVTRPLPDPFFVLASQNPIELEGTYPLPEAQLDRFLFKLEVGAASSAVMEQIIVTRHHGVPPKPRRQVSREELLSLFAMARRIVLPIPVANYIARLVAATHPARPDSPSRIRDYVAYGASPRAAIGIAEAARAHALLAGRPTAGFEDVKTVAPAVLNHRLILDYKARFDQVPVGAVIADLLAEVPEAAEPLPPGMEVRT
jgi:MoxR-like ATPase